MRSWWLTSLVSLMISKTQWRNLKHYKDHLISPANYDKCDKCSLIFRQCSIQLKCLIRMRNTTGIQHSLLHSAASWFKALSCGNRIHTVVLLGFTICTLKVAWKVCSFIIHHKKPLAGIYWSRLDSNCDMSSQRTILHIYLIRCNALKFVKHCPVILRVQWVFHKGQS